MVLLQTSSGIALIFALERSIFFLGKSLQLSIPSAPSGMVFVFLALLVLNRISRRACRAVQDFMLPALEFYGAWVPLFFSPPLVQLPLSLRGLQIDVVAKLGAVIVAGTAFSIFTTAWIVQLLRAQKQRGVPVESSPTNPPVPSSTTLTKATYQPSISLGTTPCGRPHKMLAMPA